MILVFPYQNNTQLPGGNLAEFTFDPLLGNAGVTPSYILSGPSSLTVGVSGVYTLTPNTAVIDNITFSDGGVSGVFYPTSFSFSNSSVAQTFNYAQSGIINETLTLSSSGSYVITGSPLNLSIIAPFTPTPSYWKPNPNKPTQNDGGALLGVGLSSLQNTRIFDTDYGYPYLGVRNSYHDNKPVVGSTVNGVAKAISAGSFAILHRNKYILVGFTNSVANITSLTLNNASNSNFRGQPLAEAYRNTGLKNATGGWYYQNGQPVNAQYSRDQFNTDNQGTGKNPGQIVFMIGNPNSITTQSYSTRNGS